MRRGAGKRLKFEWSDFPEVSLVEDDDGMRSFVAQGWSEVAEVAEIAGGGS